MSRALEGILPGVTGLVHELRKILDGVEIEDLIHAFADELFPGISRQVREGGVRVQDARLRVDDTDAIEHALVDGKQLVEGRNGVAHGLTPRMDLSQASLLRIFEGSWRQVKGIKARAGLSRRVQTCGIGRVEPTLSWFKRSGSTAK